MHRARQCCVVLLAVAMIGLAGCEGQKSSKGPMAVSPSNSDGKTVTAPTQTAKNSAAPESGLKKIVLGANELFAGIPGEGKLTIEQIKAWLDDSKNNEPLDYELPLGLATGAGQEKGLAENPLTRAKIELGRQLYFDNRISGDSTVSCASCHDPDQGFAAHTQFGVGVRKQTGNRNSPVAYNRILSDLQFWDGRASSLEEQAKGPIANPIEMDNTHDKCVLCIAGIPGYQEEFAKVFAENGQPGKVTIDNVAKAIASFERALVTGPSSFDYYDRFKPFEKMDPDDIKDDPALNAKFETAKTAVEAHPMSESAKRGMVLYFGDKANCSACHVGPNLADEKYHNIGIGTDKDQPDEGRYAVTHNEKDWAAFKTPTVRNVALSAPYMHDGSLKTLEEVIDWYAKGGHPNKNLDDKIKKLDLTEQDKKDLVEFLKACTGDFPKVEHDRLPQ